MGTTIGLIILSVGFIITSFCNFMTNNYQIRFQEKLNKRVTELEWQNKELKGRLSILEKDLYELGYFETKENK